MIALVPVRDGVLPVGAGEAIGECGGSAILAGSGTDRVDLTGLASDVVLVELGPYAPARWAAALAPVVAERDGGIVVVPNSPDGRDLAPRLASALDRPLLAGATEIDVRRVRLARRGGLELHDHRPAGAFVATLQPGVRGPVDFHGDPTATVVDVEPGTAHGAHIDARVVEVLPPDVHTMDLSEAATIIGGGAGLDSQERFEQLDRVATSIGGVMGATRVITDRSWVHHDRQIGTTGVVVDPGLYLAFGISGAVQHTSGLGHPDHIISVNTDPHCPMMSLSDLAIVSDANATLDELERLLSPMAPLPADTKPTNA